MMVIGNWIWDVKRGLNLDIFIWGKKDGLTAWKITQNLLIKLFKMAYVANIMFSYYWNLS